MVLNKNRVDTQIHLGSVEDLEIRMKGDRIHLFTPSLSIFIHIDEINELIERIGKAMMDKTPQPFVRR